MKALVCVFTVGTRENDACPSLVTIDKSFEIAI